MKNGLQAAGGDKSMALFKQGQQMAGLFLFFILTLYASANPLPAAITLGNLSQTYDRARKTVTVTTSPPGLNTTIYYNGSTNGFWTNVGSMSVPRIFSMAAILQTDGLYTEAQVLVAGGLSGTQNIKTAEIYTPTTGRWSPISSMNYVHNSRSTLFLPNQTILVVNGVGATFPLPPPEIYSYPFQSWQPVGQNVTPRIAGDMVLSNGKPLLIGGSSDSSFTDRLLTTELYDAKTRTWTNNGVISQVRLLYTPIALANGKVLLAGGEDTNSTKFSSAEIYDPATGHSTPTGSLHDPRSEYSAVLLSDGKVLVAGGKSDTGYLASVELYDPATGTWSLTGSLNFPRRSAQITMIDEDRVMIVGGYCNPNELNSTELYDPATGVWTVTGSLSIGREGANIIPLLDNSVLIAGGQGQTSFLASTEIYTPVVVNAGSYAVTAVINDPGYYGTNTGTLVINKINYPVNLSHLEQTYDGTAKRVSLGLGSYGSVDFTYNGSTNPPTNAGSYTVVGLINALNYKGGATNTFIIDKASAGVTLTNLTQFYDGLAKNVTVTTTPPGLAVTLRYNGSATIPTAVGSYTVTASITDSNYLGSTVKTLNVIEKPFSISTGSTTNNSFGLNFATVLNQSYTLWSATDLLSTNWSVLSNYLGDGFNQQINISATNDAQFFRLTKP